MKRMLSALTAFAVAFCCCLSLFDYAGAEQSGNCYYTISDQEATLAGWFPIPEGSIIVPSTLGGYPVTTIGRGCFSDCTNLTSVTLPSSISVIDAEAFSGCINLGNISIPYGVTRIDNKAFWHCEKIDEITIPSSIAYLGDDIFTACYSLDKVDLPSNMTAVPAGFLASCTALTKIELPDTISCIHASAFAATSLINVKIPSSVTEIGANAFYRCQSLKCVTIPDSVEAIGNRAFLDCENLESVYYDSGAMEWQAIVVGEDNLPLDEAIIHYNYENANFDGVIYDAAYSNARVTATVEKKQGFEKPAYVYLALYDGYNRLIDVTQVATVNAVTALNADVSGYTDVAWIKIMLMDSDLRPLCRSKHLTVE